MAEKRKPPGPKLRRKFAENRLKRKFLQLEIHQLAEKIDAADTAKAAFKLAMERERKIAQMRALKVRRKARKKTTGGGGLGSIGGIFS